MIFIMTFIHSDRSMFFRRKELRNNLTPQEVILWKYLKKSNLSFKFIRQHSIGPYIVDFYCPQKRLIIEMRQLLEQKQREMDSERDARKQFKIYLSIITYP